MNNLSESNGVIRRSVLITRSGDERPVICLPPDQTSIGSSAFEGRGNILSAELAVEEIGSLAFQRCSSLERLVLHEGLRRIGKCAFRNCRDLEEVLIPGSVERIGDEAFRYCEKLRRIEIRSPRTVIDWEAFGRCAPDALMIVPKGSPAESYAFEYKIKYVYPDGSEPPKELDIRVSPDGTVLENCFLRTVYIRDVNNGNGGGIDFYERYVRSRRFPASDAVFEGRKLVGVNAEGHFFRFDDPATHRHYVQLELGTGSGSEIDESITYKFVIGDPTPDTEERWG